MRTLIGWTLGAACATVIVSGISALPVQGQDVKQERKEIETSRQQLREAYKSGDRAAIKAARESSLDALARTDENVKKVARLEAYRGATRNAEPLTQEEKP